MTQKGLNLIFIIALLNCCSCGNLNSSQAYIPPYVFPNATYAIITDTATLVDTSRTWDDAGTTVTVREIPIKVTSPAAVNAGPFPLLLMSHGLGGDVNSTTYLAEYLASCGYIVVSVQHHRSDSTYLSAHGDIALAAAASQPATRLMRPQDMIFVLDAISSQSTGLSLLALSRINIAQVGVLGHSFGAFTTLACLGATFDGGINASDNRFLCGVAYSPQGPGTLGSETTSWDTLIRPVMTLAGTSDTSIGTEDPLERRIPFDKMPATNTKYHDTVLDAVHDSFGDNSLDGGFYHEWIQQLTVAFFDTYLRNNASAKKWLEDKLIENITTYITQENK